MKVFNKHPLGIALLSLLIMVGIVIAYFSNQTKSEQYTITTGSLDLEITEGVLSSDKLMPGQENPLTFMIKNTGTDPLYIKGYFEGSWLDEDLDDNLFSITHISYFKDGNIINLDNVSSNLGAEFFLSPSGLEQNLELLQPNQSLDVQIILRLSGDADDRYQQQDFSGRVHLAAKQAVDDANWPDQY